MNLNRLIRQNPTTNRLAVTRRQKFPTDD